MWTRINCSFNFVMLDNTRRIGQLIFFHWKIGFSSKTYVFNNLSGPKKCSYRFHNFVQKSFWNFKKCSLTFVMFDKTGKKAKFFSLLEFLPLSSKICVFNNHLGPEKCCYKFNSTYQKTLSTLINCYLIFFLLDNTGKIGQTICFTRKVVFFSQEFVFSTNPLGPKIMLS